MKESKRSREYYAVRGVTHAELKDSENQGKYWGPSLAVPGEYWEQTSCCQRINSEGGEVLEAARERRATEQA